MAKSDLYGTIDLICSDGGKVIIEKQLLNTNSTVFAGMLDGAQGKDYTIAELQEDMLRIVGIILAEDFPTGGDDWLRLARIADKYDMPLVLSRLENICW